MGEKIVMQIILTAIILGLPEEYKNSQRKVNFFKFFKILSLTPGKKWAMIYLKEKSNTFLGNKVRINPKIVKL